MSKTDQGLPGANDAPLSDEVLKAIVGGTRPEDAKPMEGDRAAALTAGAETGGFADVGKHGFLPPGSSHHTPGAAPKAGASENAAPAPHADGSVTATATSGWLKGATDAAHRVGVSAEIDPGVTAKPGGQAAAGGPHIPIKIDGLDRTDVGPQVQGGFDIKAASVAKDSSAKDLGAKDPGVKPDVPSAPDHRGATSLEIEVSSAKSGAAKEETTFRTGADVAMSAAVTVDPPAGTDAGTLTKAAALASLSPERIKEIEAEFRDIHGTKLKAGIDISKTSASKSTEKDLADSGDTWKTTTKSTALDKQKADEKAAAAVASKAQDAHVADLLAKTTEARTQTAQQAGVKTAEQNVKAAFDQLVKAQQSALKDGGGDVQHAQKLTSLAQDIHTLNTQTVKDTEASYKNAIQADKPAHEIKKAEDAYRAAILDQQASQKQLATYKDDLSKKVADKVQDKAADLKKADDALAKARSDAGEETRPRANSAPTGSAAEKPPANPVKAAGDAPAGHDVNAQIEKALREAQAMKASAEANKKAEDAAKDKAKKDAELRQKVTGFAVSAADQALTEAAKADAKGHGTYSKTTTTDVTHGGVESETREADGVKVTTNTLHQTTLKHGGESWDSELGHGKNGVWAPKAEAGYETVTEVTNASGDKTIVKDSAYAGAEFENKAGYSVTDVAVNADASSKIVGHAEIKHSETSTVLGLEVTTEKSIAAHGEAGVKAGLHLGFDGVKAEVAAKAEATVSATGSHEVKIGEGSAKVSADVFVQAKAEAKAGADVTFDPLAGKVNAKIGASAEAGVGVGADAEGSLKSKDGNGVSVGAHVKVGTIGATFEPEVKIENGKVDLKVTVGGYLGIGGKVDIGISGDYKKAAKNFENAKDVFNQMGPLFGSIYIYGKTVRDFFS